MLLGGEYNIFELVGCVMDLFIIQDLIVSLYVYEFYVIVDILKFYEFMVVLGCAQQLDYWYCNF
jgi:hypothetical protein